MRRISRVTAAFAVAATTLSLAGPAGAASPSPDTVERQAASTSTSARLDTPVDQPNRPTRFSLKSWGYGTKIDGGQVPVGSGSTAFDVIACANETGLRKHEGIATVALPGDIVKVNAADTNLWTERRAGGKEVHVFSTSKVAGVTLFESSLGKLEISAFSSLSHVWHDGSKFHAETKTSPAGLTFTDANGGVQELPLPTDQIPVIEVPGLARIHLGHDFSKARRDGARAFANALKIEVIPTNTKVTLGHSSVSMQDGITNGLLGGFAFGLDAKGLDGIVKVGRTPQTILPCRGTDGEEITKSLVDLGPAGSPLDGALEVGVLKTTAFGKQTAKKTWGWTRAELADVNLGDGQLIIRGLKAQANVSRTRAGKVVANANGSTLGELVVDGEPQALPDPGQAIEIPGLAKVEFNLVEKPRRNVVTVTGIRVTLLDGTGLVLNIAQAKAKIDKSGL